ncbi:MAG: D-alanine-D-alanine ligase [Actinomycetota bacterium]|nr:D-alanine-D-alanine ligase [Actinomycetota bacterium]
MSDPAVIFGGPSPEHDVSILTGLQAVQALAKAGHRVTALYWSKTGDWFSVDPGVEAKHFLDGAPAGAAPVRLVASTGGGFVASARLGRDRPIEISGAVNCCHGGPGEDGSLSAALDLAGVRYTGPSVSAAALGMDKLAFGAVVTAAGLPSLPRAALTAAGDVDFDGPYIVKPRYGGSSIGIDTVADLDTARARLSANVHLKGGAVIEPYRPDSYDLNIAVRTWPELELSAIEKPLRSDKGSDILGYADKYVGGEGMVSAPRELPAAIDDATAESIRAMAARIVEVAAVRGIARIDFLADGDGLYVNEINTIPGSLAKYLWVEPPVSFDRLLSDMLDEAERRPTTAWTVQGADGSALRSAGSIASKLA